MVICLDGLSEKEKKAHLKFAFLFPKSFELIKQEGRVEGAIEELKLIENEFFPMINVDGRKYVNFESLNSYFEKRLKELESKGVN